MNFFRRDTPIIHEDEPTVRVVQKTMENPLGQEMDDPTPQEAARFDRSKVINAAISKATRDRETAALAMRDFYVIAHDEWAKRHAEFIEGEVAIAVEKRLAAPTTHTYRGVSVTEDQFEAFAKLDGYGWPKK